MAKNKLSAGEQDALLQTLKTRFEQNPQRPTELSWDEIEARLQQYPAKLRSLQQMEASGGEPDLVAVDSTTGELIFYDCSPETPTGRRNLCYDREALEARKKNKPENSCLDMCREMGIELLTEAEYRELQETRALDLKTSSWVATPERIRQLGGALFCDRRYDTVFVYHNSAESYYSSRGFRGQLKV